MTNNISSTKTNHYSKLVAESSIKVIPTAAYIHIPFCRRRCYYCDFPISVVGDKGVNSAKSMVEDYIAALIKDIQLTTSTIHPLKTVFFGGGTPSLLSSQQLGKILQAIALHFGLATDAEISMEIDPGTFDRDKLLGYIDIGINRFSLGVQTFDEELLQVCGRSHTLADVMEAVSIIKQLNVENFSLDLISGLPHQTIEHCRSSLAQAIAIAPKHLSCYDLVLEPVTAFGKQYQPGETPLPNDDDTAEMYRLTQKTLTAAGYEHYEISNYAQPGYQCLHNRVYWENKPYYGFGMGAASYVNGKRFICPRTRREYYAWLEAGAIVDAPQVSSTDYLLETLMLGLRLTEGIDLAQFNLDTKEKIWSCLQPYYRQGWVEVISQDGKLFHLTEREEPLKSIARLRLQDPEGFLFSNTILSRLFQAFE
ncbi:radical SAM family heme chaperone HemW [Pleurocapsa sp. PCC 7319]|uniref:radical SAM family heme chaperone HemW n=1 Tax=Pleurocapsa sp. PCC 7319 TaxID=118161 RepID=UPI00034C396F|nr:radical SAM family heme chaperone HemW [Pleurocapsa sp. PCC 7319]